MVFENEEGELLIYDWKRSREITLKQVIGTNALM
jgi:hypothetical protein